MKSKFLPLFAILFGILFYSCKSEYEKQSEKFFKAYNNQDFQTLKSLSHENFSDISVDISKQIFELYGKIDKYEIVFTDTIIENSEVADIVIYEVITVEKDEKFYIEFIYPTLNNESFLFSGLIFNEDKDFLINIKDNQRFAKEMISDFYTYRFEKNYVEIKKLLDFEEIDEFTTLLKQVEDYYGELADYFVFYSIPLKYENNTVVVLQIECTTVKNITYYEEIDVVKSNEGMFKIFDYKARENRYELTTF